MDLNSLPLQELRKLKDKVEREIGKREAAGKKTLLKRLQKMGRRRRSDDGRPFAFCAEACRGASQEGA